MLRCPDVRKKTPWTRALAAQISVASRLVQRQGLKISWIIPVFIAASSPCLASSSPGSSSGEKPCETSASNSLDRGLTTGIDHYMTPRTPASIDSATMINQVQEAEATIASFSTSGTIISDSISTYVDELWISVISHAVAIGTLVPTAEASSTDTSNGEVIESMVPANSGKSSYATTSTARVEVRGSSSLGTGGVDTLTTDRMRVNSIMEELFTRTEKPEAFSTTKSTESRVIITSTVTSEQKETVTRALSGQTSPTSLICGNPTDLPGRSDADPQFWIVWASHKPSGNHLGKTGRNVRISSTKTAGRRAVIMRGWGDKFKLAALSTRYGQVLEKARDIHKTEVGFNQTNKIDCWAL
ncbi:hypothetical protein IWW34DRAFT_812551 [Fusarium oxysporum f. sp. albedinis]|nr:hypothetical protein IWW34DRAFT_812551 [Fusarium oxysporum f. sp. albedinis]